MRSSRCERVAGGRDGHEHASDNLRRCRCRGGCRLRLRVHVRRLERGPQEGEVETLLRAGAALHRHADGGRRHVEGDACDRDRQRRRVGADRRSRPPRPQHIDHIDEGHRCDRQRTQGAAARAADGSRAGGEGSAGFAFRRPAQQSWRFSPANQSSVWVKADQKSGPGGGNQSACGRGGNQAAATKRSTLPQRGAPAGEINP